MNAKSETEQQKIVSLVFLNEQTFTVNAEGYAHAHFAAILPF